MHTELHWLIGVTIIAMLQPLPYLLGYFKYWGFGVAAGNRDAVPALPKWAQRAQRAHANMVENYAHFAVLVFLLAYFEVSNEWTMLGVMLFFWARLAYWPTYIIGIPYLRTVVFLIGLAGEFVLLFQLLLTVVG